MLGMAVVDIIIFECVDSALSELEFLDKENFYYRLEISHGIKPKDIGTNYHIFHDLLKNDLGKQHYKVERKILEILKQRTKAKIYNPLDEINVFNIITEVMIEETKENTKRKNDYLSLKNYVEVLESKVENQNDKLKNIERLATIGATAGMVGHDIRNPLQAIVGDVYLTKQDIESLPENEIKQSIRENLEAIEQNAQYINKIVLDLQDYARPSTPIIKELCLASFIKEVVKKTNIPLNIKLIQHIENTTNIFTDSDILKRILDNLIMNAIQAMPDGGTLTIQTRKETSNYIIMIEDTGIGIPDETKPRLFAPMFTTKAKGQGFGLAVVKRLTEALGGTITFESEIGKETKFVITLPVKQH